MRRFPDPGLFPPRPSLAPGGQGYPRFCQRLPLTPDDAYQELTRRSREEWLLHSCADLLEWDEQTYMPRGGAEHRGDQMALLAGLLHDRGTAPRLGELLDTIDGSALVAEPDSPAAVNVREIRRGYERERKIPRALKEEQARVAALAQQAWVAAREDDDFPRFLPWLEQTVRLTREEAEAVGYEHEPYDALLDEYEVGTRARDLEALFGELRRELVPLVEAIKGTSRHPVSRVLGREFPVDRQRAFGEAVADALGFDLERGRIDVAPHPFCCTIGPGDCRLTARYSSRDFADGFFSLIHEVGHGLYEQGLDPAHVGLPMGQAVSLGIHESQSRLWENLVARSHAFWEHYFPLAREFFHEPLREVALDDFHLAANRVEPSLIRVKADEVTYNLHVMVRFELERALVSGDLVAGDVPQAWNEAYRRYLGVTPSSDTEGCLQDTHWSEGLFGYFPTYTLGNLYAAQLFDAARNDLGNLDLAFSSGEFRILREWLRDKIHQHGHRYVPADLIARASGTQPSARPLIEGLQAKYRMLYRL